MFKKFVKELLDMWNFYGGFIVSSLLAWLYGFNSTYMDRTTSYIIMLLAFVGLFTTIKRTIYPIDKKTNILEKATLAQPRIKAIDSAVNTDKATQDLCKTILKTTTLVERMVKFIMNKVKNFFKRVWGNKATIMNILINLVVVAVADYLLFADYLSKFEFIAQNELLFKILVPILGTIYLILDIYTTVSKYGWENLKELELKAEQKRVDKENRLPKEQREILKKSRTELKKVIAEIENKLEQINKEIQQFEVMAKYVSVSDEDIQKQNNNINVQYNLQKKLENHKSALANIEKSLK